MTTLLTPITETRDRLTLCHAEIDGINASYPNYRHVPLKLSDPPVVVHSVLGWSGDTDASNRYQLEVVILARVVVAPLLSDRDGDNGSEGMDTAVELMDKFLQYHVDYPRLKLPDGTALYGVEHPIRFASRFSSDMQIGVSDKQLATYIGFDLELTIRRVGRRTT